MAIEVTNAGGMGALAASYYQPDELERILTDMDAKTSGRPYCIDVLFANKVGQVVPMSQRLSALPKEHLDFVERILDEAVSRRYRPTWKPRCFVKSRPVTAIPKKAFWKSLMSS
ncbi:hypothetical protein [Bradyrhizobium sp. NBAIM08]|uniref:hypothetical protein n=1 Tax=Bradyrhizobium sp. NBAIM08 TaxID=2793815 RepID=UPI001CD30E22|nr:hypothetical protein [Bradyrhizobium sp. NBAIM08]MCA1474247.1 hypothetical protein [Bradyrhizobium sp. NBAIM08]